MPYLPLDHNYGDHPKVDALSDAAYRLHTQALLWCSRTLTDGHVPEDRVRRLVPTFKPAALRELLAGDKPMWVPAAGGGYTIHDYLDWNDTRDEVLAAREHIRKVRSAAGKKGAAKRWQQNGAPS